MKISMNEIRKLNKGINMIMEERVPPETAQHIKRVVKTFMAKMDEFERLRIKLAREYAKKDEKGEPKTKFIKGGKGEPDQRKYDMTKENRIKMALEWDKANEELIDFPFEPLDVTKEVFGESVTADLLYNLGILIKE